AVSRGKERFRLLPTPQLADNQTDFCLKGGVFQAILGVLVASPSAWKGHRHGLLYPADLPAGNPRGGCAAAAARETPHPPATLRRPARLLPCQPHYPHRHTHL